MKVRSDFIDCTGQRFGKLVALRSARDDRGRSGFWCRCDCGTEKFITGGNLRKGKSCGCDYIAAQLRACWRHGHSRRPEYNVFCTMKQRCGNPNSEKWANYGALGVENRFRDFEHFFACIGPRPSPKHSLDRIDNFGHYEPGNVRWATASQQQRNRRRPVASLAFRDYPAMVASPLSFGA
jgi:hypothetical protein